MRLFILILLLFSSFSRSEGLSYMDDVSEDLIKEAKSYYANEDFNKLNLELKRLLQLNNINIEYLRAAFLFDNNEFESYEHESYHLLKKISDNGHLEGAFLLGRLAQRENRTPYSNQVFKSKLLSHTYLLKAAKGGHPLSMGMVGNAYREGKIVEKNLNTALHWFEKAAELGEPASQYLTAYLYSGAIEGHKSNAKVEYWLCRAAEQQFQPAIEEAKNMSMCQSKRINNQELTNNVPPVNKIANTNSGAASRSKSKDGTDVIIGALFDALESGLVYKLFHERRLEKKRAAHLREVEEAARRGARRGMRKALKKSQIINFKYPKIY